MPGSRVKAPKKPSTSFTPLHDAVHRSLSRHRGVNDVLGFFGAFTLLPGITARIYRYLHLEHHKHTGDVRADPDDSFVTSKGLWAVLSWIGIDVIWTTFYFKNVRSRPLDEVIEFCVGLSIYIGLHIYFLAFSPWAWEFFLLWMLPQRLGIFLVVYFFAHIQHPDGILQRVHPFHGTVMIKGGGLSRALLLGQNHHLIHHLYPSIPWYRYADVYTLGKHVFDQQSLIYRPLLGRCHPMTAPGPREDKRQLSVREVVDAGGRVKRFTLVDPDGRKLPSFTPGAHIDLFLGKPFGAQVVRQYSIVGGDELSYQIAVQREDAGRGGSKLMHQQLTVGATVEVGGPRNLFPLALDEDEVILVGGGIGVTPLLAMARALREAEIPFTLHHAVRGEDAPQVELLTEGEVDAVVHVDEEGRSALNPASVFGTWRPGRRAYLCGPAGFMAWLVSEATRLGWPADALRLESFSPHEDDRERRRFEVVLARSKKVLQVEPERSLLEVLDEAKAGVPSNCTSGLCGACQCVVLEGEVEHRDSILSEEERARNDVMYVCVSRAQGERLTLDL
ncbi:MAG: fatty acid desaturase [Myxococcota bacterium]